jgi:hypothetical protein
MNKKINFIIFGDYAALLLRKETFTEDPLYVYSYVRGAKKSAHFFVILFLIQQSLKCYQIKTDTRTVVNHNKF